jgi:predicted nucleic acid binding AN1-type Zn finger protein
MKTSKFLPFSLIVLLSSCSWGFRNNPADPGAVNYQGYTTVSDPNAIEAEIPADGRTLYSTTLTASKVIGAAGYELAIAESATSLETAPLYRKADYSSNGMDISASGIQDKTTYWWKVRARGADRAWGAWSAARSFTTAWSTPAATPTFNPNGGTYTTDQSVTIGCTTPNSTIYYTTDGTAPTTGSTRYTGGIAISGHGTVKTIKAIATAAGYSASGIGSATYTISYPAAATPTFNPAGGTYTTDQSVTISCTTPNSTIYYTTNGDTPTTSSTQYTVGIAVAGHGTVKTIKAIATAAGYSASGIGSATYTISYPAAATPTFSPAGGKYTTDQTVMISCTTPNSTIYYTPNGDTPTTSSTQYAGTAITATVNPPTMINAIAVAPGFSQSEVATATYRLPYSIGDTGPAGGIVFYVKGSYSNGWRYLEAAPSDQSTGTQWWNGSGTWSGAIGGAVGTGAANTAAIVATLGEGSYAAKLCADLVFGGYDDWFLPSMDELNLMYVNLKQQNRGGFASTDYWSSSELSNQFSNYAWSQTFFGGHQQSCTKDYSYHVRAARVF